MVTVELRQTNAPRIIPPHVSLWYTGIEEELNPFPYPHKLQHPQRHRGKSNSHDPSDDTADVELCQCCGTGQDGLRNQDWQRKVPYEAEGRDAPCQQAWSQLQP